MVFLVFEELDLGLPLLLLNLSSLLVPLVNGFLLALEFGDLIVKLVSSALQHLYSLF